jgi:hypothetical protein
MENKIRINVDIMAFIILLVLKLDGIIDWKWFWIFSPFWIVWIAQISVAIICAISNIEFKRNVSHVAPGSPLIWDTKTNTLYGPHNKEDNVND